MFAAARTSLRTASVRPLFSPGLYRNLSLTSNFPLQRTVARRSYATAPLVVEAEPGQAAWWISAAVGVGALAFIFTQKGQSSSPLRTYLLEDYPLTLFSPHSQTPP